MEAANKGASRVPGSRNMGMGITLPFEEGKCMRKDFGRQKSNRTAILVGDAWHKGLLSTVVFIHPAGSSVLNPQPPPRPSARSPIEN